MTCLVSYTAGPDTRQLFQRKPAVGAFYESPSDGASPLNVGRDRRLAGVDPPTATSNWRIMASMPSMRDSKCMMSARHTMSPACLFCIAAASAGGRWALLPRREPSDSELRRRAARRCCCIRWLTESPTSIRAAAGDSSLCKEPPSTSGDKPRAAGRTRLSMPISVPVNTPPGAAASPAE